VRRECADLSGAPVRVECAGPVELSPVGGALTGAPNGQVSAHAEDQSGVDLGAPKTRSSSELPRDLEHWAPGFSCTEPSGAHHDHQNCERCGTLASKLIHGECQDCAWQREPEIKETAE